MTECSHCLALEDWTHMKDTRESSRLGYALSTPHNLSPVVRSPTLGGGSCPLGDPEPQGLQRDAEAAISTTISAAAAAISTAMTGPA